MKGKGSYFYTIAISNIYYLFYLEQSPSLLRRLRSGYSGLRYRYGASAKKPCTASLRSLPYYPLAM